MRKAICSLGVLLAACAFSSCKQECDCKFYVDGVHESQYDYTKEADDCKTAGTLVEINGVKNGFDCK